MPITHTNCKGVTYTLCQGVTKSGKPRYYFTPNPGDNALDAIPDGWEIRESVNGIVSLVRRRPQAIADAEAAAVRAALNRLEHGARYRVEVRGKRIVVFERQGPDADAIAELLGPGLLPNEPKMDRLGALLDERARFAPVMRFTLVDAKQRRFSTEHMGYGVSREGWQASHRTATIDELATTLIPTLVDDEYDVS